MFNQRKNPAAWTQGPTLCQRAVPCLLLWLDNRLRQKPKAVPLRLFAPRVLPKTKIPVSSLSVRTGTASPHDQAPARARQSSVSMNFCGRWGSPHPGTTPALLSTAMESLWMVSSFRYEPNPRSLNPLPTLLKLVVCLSCHGGGTPVEAILPQQHLGRPFRLTGDCSFCTLFCAMPVCSNE